MAIITLNMNRKQLIIVTQVYFRIILSWAATPTHSRHKTIIIPSPCWRDSAPQTVHYGWCSLFSHIFRHKICLQGQSPATYSDSVIGNDICYILHFQQIQNLVSVSALHWICIGSAESSVLYTNKEVDINIIFLQLFTPYTLIHKEHCIEASN